MSVMFHREENLVISSSLDNKIYVWDYTELKQKHEKYSGDKKGKKAEIFTRIEVEVKNICEGHEKGVNFACFHPNRSLIASRSEDELIKLWRMSGARAWEMDTLRGHQNNVSWVAFHPKLDILISNFEDKTMKIWDLNRRTCIYTLKKEVNKFWVVAVHPTQNYFACGYDRGMAIYKLENEHYSYQRIGNQLFYVRNKVLMIEDLTNVESLPQANLEIEGKQVLMNQPDHIYYNYFDNADHDILINYQQEEGFSVLIILNKNLNKNSKAIQRKIESTNGAVFIAKDKLWVLSKSKNLFIYLFDGRNKKIEWKDDFIINKIFQATIGKILIKSGDDVLLFDIVNKTVVAEAQFTNLQYVYWSSNMSYVALCSKTMIMVCNKNLEPLWTIKESSKFKSGWFDNENGFIYSTYSHLKYLLVHEFMKNDSAESSNNSGIFKALENPVYVWGFVGSFVFYINRESKVIRQDVNTAEYELKIALKSKKINDVIKILKRGQLSGNAVINYLRQENCSDIALLFEKDPKTRFSLALSSGNIHEAYKNASEIQEKDTYLQLAEQSLLQGFFNVAEKSYQSIKAFSKLSSLYAIQGCQIKMTKMQKISHDLNNKNEVFQNSLLLGTIKDRIKLLMQSNQIALAYMTAKAHKVEEYIPLIEDEMRNRGLPLTSDFANQLQKRVSKSKSLLPWRPVFMQNDQYMTSNWPITMLVQSNVKGEVLNKPEEDKFYDAIDQIGIDSAAPEQQIYNQETSDFSKPADTKDKMDEGDDVGNDNWGNEIELDDLLNDMDQNDQNIDPDNVDFDIDINEDQPNVSLDPIKSADPLQKIAYHSQIAAHHIIIGNFEDALELLKKQIGLDNPQIYNEVFDMLYSNAKQIVPKLPKTFDITAILKSQIEEGIECIITYETLQKIYKEGLTNFAKGVFKDSLLSFQKCIQYAPLCLAATSEEEEEIKKLISNCVEYIISCKIELKRREAASSNNSKENLELALLMTMCKLSPSHQFLAFKNAMNICYKAQNFINAAYFSRKILSLEPTGVSLVIDLVFHRYSKVNQSW